MTGAHDTFCYLGRTQIFNQITTIDNAKSKSTNLSHESGSCQIDIRNKSTKNMNKDYLHIWLQ